MITKKLSLLRHHTSRTFTRLGIFLNSQILWIGYKTFSLSCISSDQFSLLSNQVTMDEVKEAIFQLKAFKAPRPGGMLVVVFHRYQNFMQSDIFRLVREFFNGLSNVSSFNATFISFIPKCEHPETFKDFRPIGLCNVVYKIISNFSKQIPRHHGLPDLSVSKCFHKRSSYL